MDEADFTQELVAAVRLKDLRFLQRIADLKSLSAAAADAEG